MKICLFDGCTNPVYSHLFCKYHQSKRTDNKAMEARNKTVQPRSPIKPYKRTTSDKSELKTTKNSLCFSWGFRSQAEMFKHIWETREHKCLFTGSNLDLVPKCQFHWMFLHVLRKGAYRYFKHNPDNIALGHPNFHLAADNFTEEERTKHPTWNFDLFFQMQDQKKTEYKKFLEDNML